MKTGKTRLALLTVLALVMVIAMLLCSCADNADPSTSGNGEPTTSGGAVVPDPTDPVEEDDADLSLYFKDGNTVTASVKESRKISVHTESNYLLISGEGNFTVTVNGNTLSPENGELTIENTAADYVSMDMQIDVDAEMTLTFTLIFNPGTAGNPYAVSATEQTQLTYEGEVYFTAPAGWYTIVSEDSFELVNYSLGENGLVYLAEDTYTVGTKAEGESVLTITPAATPQGYSEEDPILVTELGTVELTMYSGVKMYFRFEAPQDGLYLFSLGTEGKSPNSRFTVNESGIYYGKYYENGVWSTYENGTVYGQWFNEEGGLTIVVDYSVVGSSEDGTGMVGSDIIQIVVSEPYNFSTVKTDVILNKEPKGILYAAFTAPADGIYGIQLGAEGDADEYVRLTLDWNIGEDEVATYYYLWDTAVVKLSEGETIYIAIDSETSVGGTVSLFISEETTLPLPEEGWLTGYYKGSKYMIYLDRDKGQVTFSNASGSSNYGICDITYDGETVTFVQGEGSNATTWTLVYDSETGNMTLSSSSTSDALSWYEPAAEKDISTLQGIYASEDGDVLSIAADGSGVYQNSRYDYDGSKNYYNTSSIDNILHWGAYITIELGEDGQSVSVGSKDSSGSWTYTVYTRTESTYTLPTNKLTGIDVGEYTGADYSLTITSSDQKVNTREFYVLAVSDDGVYTISALSTDHDWTIFTLEISDGVVTLKDESGALVDTLTVYVYPTAALPAETEAAALPSAEMEQKYGMFYIYKIQTDGWYSFSGEARLYVPWSSGEVYPDPFGNGVEVATADTWYELKAGDLVAVTSTSVKVTYSAEEVEVEYPELVDGKLTVTTSNATLTYYKFTAPSDGTYVVKMNLQNYHLLINNVSYGTYSSTMFKYTDYVAAYCEVDLKAGEALIIGLQYRIVASDETPCELTVTLKGADNEVDLTPFLGTWTGSIYGTDYKVVITEDGVSYWMDEIQGADNATYYVDGDTLSFAYSVAVSAYYTDKGTANLTLSDGKLLLSTAGDLALSKEGDDDDDDDDDDKDESVSLAGTGFVGEWTGGNSTYTAYVTITDNSVSYYYVKNSNSRSYAILTDCTSYTLANNVLTIGGLGYDGSYSITLTLSDGTLTLVYAAQGPSGITLSQGDEVEDLDITTVIGIWEAVDNDGIDYKVTISQSGITIAVYGETVCSNVTDYTISGNEITVSYEVWSNYYASYYLTVTDEGIVLANDSEELVTLELTGSVEDSDKSDDGIYGTYSGTSGNGYLTYQVVLSNSTVEITYWYTDYADDVYTLVAASAYSWTADGKLTLTYDPYGDGYSYTIEITFNEDGTIDVYDSYNDYAGTGEMLATGLSKQDSSSDGIYGTWSGDDGYDYLYKVELTETGVSYWEGYDLDQMANNVAYTQDGNTITFTATYSWDTAGEYGWEVQLVIAEDGTMGFYKDGELYATLTKDGGSTSSGSAEEETGLISSTFVGSYWTTDWDLLTVSTTGIGLYIGNDELTPTVSATLQTDVYAFTYEGGTYDGEYCYLYLYSYDDGSCAAYLNIGGNDPIIFYK